MPDLELNPYAGVDWDAVERRKAQFHAHSSYPPVEGHSGADPPEVVIDDYREAGYAALALTGHEYNVEEPTWPWTDWDRDPAALGMVAIQAAELGGGGERIDHDLLSLFSNFADTTGMSIHEALAEIGDRDGLAIFPHPGRYHHGGEWYVEYFRTHPHLLGVEVVNAADRYPTDRDVWDDLLGRISHERPVWGFADDDYHGRDQGYPFDRSRNVLLLEEATPEAVREALVEGRFFYQHVVENDPSSVTEEDSTDDDSSTADNEPTADNELTADDEPPTVEAIRHDPDRGELAVEARGWDRIQWASAGEVVGRDPTLRYREADGLGRYVRARLVAEGGSETGTQPFLLS